MIVVIRPSEGTTRPRAKDRRGKVDRPRSVHTRPLADIAAEEMSIADVIADEMGDTRLPMATLDWIVTRVLELDAERRRKRRGKR